MGGRMCRLLLLLLLLVVAAGSGAARAQNIPARLGAAVTRVQDVLAESFARSLPLPAASAGVSPTST
jgi:hypothetical protein